MIRAAKDDRPTLVGAGEVENIRMRPSTGLYLVWLLAPSVWFPFRFCLVLFQKARMNTIRFRGRSRDGSRLIRLN
jgi:hypothetical protein